MPHVIDSMDFRGGYATDIPPERMEANMVLKSENLYWQNGLVGRGGKAQYSTLSTYATVTRGRFRMFLPNSSVWQDVAAFDNGVDVEIYRSTGTTWNPVSTSIKFQTGFDVKMDLLNDNLIIVNGYDRPHTLYFSTGSTYTLTSLDRYDTRTISTFDWTAGSRFTTGTTEYVDKSTEAYSTVAADFPITPTTVTSDGHYIASDYPFTRVVYTSASNLTTVAIAAYHYYTSTGWKVMTSVIELSPQWTTSTGRSTAIDDRIMEIPYLSDWAQVGSTTMGVNLENKFAVRVTFPTAPTTVGNAQKIALTDIHYLTRIMGDERPAKVRVHNNRVYLASGNNVQISPYNLVTGWDAFSVEYFQDGGQQIESMNSFQDYLFIVKPGALYGFFGNSYENWTKRKLSNMGSNWGDSVAVIGEIVAFLSRDGVRMWNGTENVLVSKHILSDVVSWSATGANAIAYKGFYLLSFPAATVILLMDPDSFRRDDMGDGRVSFFKYGTTMQVDAMSWRIGALDDGLLIATENSTVPKTVQLETTSGFESTAVIKDFKSRYNSDATPQTYKRSVRLKPDFAGPGAWTLILSADNGDTATTDITIALGITSTFTAGSHYTTDVTVPYQMDGKNLAVELQTASTSPVKIFGFSADVEIRRY